MLDNQNRFIKSSSSVETKGSMAEVQATKTSLAVSNPELYYADAFPIDSDLESDEPKCFRDFEIERHKFTMNIENLSDIKKQIPFNMRVLDSTEKGLIVKAYIGGLCLAVSPDILKQMEAYISNYFVKDIRTKKKTYLENPAPVMKSTLPKYIKLEKIR